jgi:hypothetical protein
MLPDGDDAKALRLLLLTMVTRLVLVSATATLGAVFRAPLLALAGRLAAAGAAAPAASERPAPPLPPETALRRRAWGDLRSDPWLVPQLREDLERQLQEVIGFLAGDACGRDEHADRRVRRLRGLRGAQVAQEGVPGELQDYWWLMPAGD